MRDPAAFYEVLFKVGNRPDADEHKNWMDGQPIMVKPRGAWLSPGEFKLWLDTGAMSVAANAVLMNRGREKHARVRAHAVAVLAREHKLKELAERLGIKEADAKTLVEDAKSWVNKGMTLGYDTNWGYADLSAYGVIGLEMTPVQADELMQPYVDPFRDALAKYDELAKRAYRICYESIFHDEKIEHLMSPRVYVPVDRVTFLPFEKAVRPYLCKQAA